MIASSLKCVHGSLPCQPLLHTGIFLGWALVLGLVLLGCGLLLYWSNR